MSNNDIRKKIQECNVKKWEVAAAIGITDSTFSKWLRFELSPDKREAIFEAIDKLVAERR